MSSFRSLPNACTKRTVISVGPAESSKGHGIEMTPDELGALMVLMIDFVRQERARNN